MKKIIITFFTVCALPIFAAACDICGCGAGNNYIGILPDFQKHIFGLRYRSNHMLSHVGVNGTHTYLTTSERYNTLEAWGGWNITENFRLMLSLPYSFNEKTNQGITERKNGIGDISFSGYYELLNKRSTVDANKKSPKLLVQSLWVGGGVKLPTGNYDPAGKAIDGENANLFQLGTGSVDYNLTAMYDIRLQDMGLNINTSYKINSSNKYSYQYGNKFNVNTQLYHKFRLTEKVMIAPNAGLQFESSKIDMDENTKVSASGGNLLLGTLGMETAIGMWALGANFQTPFSQNMANGIVKSKDRFMVHVAIAL